MGLPRPRSGEIFGWILYDFSNTIFSMNVVSLYFSLWITIDNGMEDLWVSVANSASMALVAISMPVLGILSDLRQKRMPFLMGYTFLCVVFTAGIGLAGWTIVSPRGRVAAALICFVVANYGYQGGLVFYNALLPQVSTEASRGRISGYGVAMGYLGAIAGMIMVMPFNEGMALGVQIPWIEGGGRIATFVPTAVLFLLFSLPTFLLVKDRGEEIRAPARISWTKIWAQVWDGLANTRRYPGLLRFLVAKYLYEDAISTVIIFMAVYAEKVVGFSDEDLVLFFVISTTSAVLGSLLFGHLTDRWGPKHTLMVVLWGWLIALSGAVFLSSVRAGFWCVGSLLGALLGGTWTSSRPLLVRLVPEEMVGEFFGLYALSGKVAAIGGPLIWGGVILAFGPWGMVKYKVAVGVLALMIAAGLAVLRGVPDVGGQVKSPAAAID